HRSRYVPAACPNRKAPPRSACKGCVSGAPAVRLLVHCPAKGRGRVVRRHPPKRRAFPDLQLSKRDETETRLLHGAYEARAEQERSHGDAHRDQDETRLSLLPRREAAVPRSRFGHGPGPGWTGPAVPPPFPLSHGAIWAEE